MTQATPRNRFSLDSITLNARENKPACLINQALRSFLKTIRVILLNLFSLRTQFRSFFTKPLLSGGVGPSYEAGSTLAINQGNHGLWNTIRRLN